MKQFKVIMTQDYCDIISRKGYADFENPHVYLKPINKVWKMLKGGYDARNTMVVDDSKGKHACNDRGNYVIKKYYNYGDVNDIFLLELLRPCLVFLNGVNDVRFIIKKDYSLLNNM